MIDLTRSSTFYKFSL